MFNAFFHYLYEFSGTSGQSDLLGKCDGKRPYTSEGSRQRIAYQISLFGIKMQIRGRKKGDAGFRKYKAADGFHILG